MNLRQKNLNKNRGEIEPHIFISKGTVFSMIIIIIIIITIIIITFLIELILSVSNQMHIFVFSVSIHISDIILFDHLNLLQVLRW